MPSETKPELLRSQLPAIVEDVIAAKRQSLRDEYGSDSGYGIRGIVVVGSVAAGTERPDSDIDVYVLSSTEGYDLDFTEMIGSKVGRYVDRLGVEIIDVDQPFTDADWRIVNAASGFPEDSPFKIILHR